MSSTILGLAIGLGVGIASRSFVSEASGSAQAAARPELHAQHTPPAASAEHDDRGVSNTLTASIAAVQPGEAEPLDPSGKVSEPKPPTIRPVVRDARPRAARRLAQRAHPRVNARPASRVRRGNATKRGSKGWARRNRKLRL